MNNIIRPGFLNVQTDLVRVLDAISLDGANKIARGDILENVVKEGACKYGAHEDLLKF
jgi:hypothetical protein